MAKELTLQDVLDGMNERFNMVFEELKRFDQVYSHLHALRTDMKTSLETQSADGEILDEMRDTLESISKAVDKDAVTIIDHERRIRTLEKTH